MTPIAAVLVPLALILAGCASTPRNSAEAAWQRGQCEQIVDPKMREKCLERVENDFGRW